MANAIVVGPNRPLLVLALLVAACRPDVLADDALLLQVVNESRADAAVIGLPDEDGPLGGNAAPGRVGGCGAFVVGLPAGSYRLTVRTLGGEVPLTLSAPAPASSPPTRTVVIRADGSVDLDAPNRPHDQPPCLHPGADGT